MKKILEIFELLRFEPKLFIEIINGSPISYSSFKNISNLRNYIDEPEIIIDVGANVGQFAFMANLFYSKSRIICFEPSYSNFDKLNKNLSKYKNIELNNIGLGEEKGEFEFYNYSYNQISSFKKINKSNDNPNYENSDFIVEKIDVTTLDYFFSNQNLGKSTLLKLDVQGFEEHVLLGGKSSLKKIKYVLLEIAFEQLYEEQILFAQMYEFLDELGYSLIAPIGFNLGKNNKIIEADCLFRRKK